MSRILSGAICGAVIHGTVKRPLAEDMVLGGLGALAGAITAHHIRHKLNHDIPDFAVGLLEDALASGGSAVIVAVAAPSE